MKAHEYYSRAMLLAADRTMSVRCRSMAELSVGWTVDVSPMPAHRCIAERLTQPEGKQINQSMALLIYKCHAGLDAPHPTFAADTELLMAIHELSADFTARRTASVSDGTCDTA